MKALYSTAANFFSGPAGDGSLEPLIEIVLIASEPGYLVDNEGMSTREPLAETMRFVSSAVGLREFAKQLNEYADRAGDDLSECVKNQVLKLKEQCKRDATESPAPSPEAA